MNLFISDAIAAAASAESSRQSPLEMIFLLAFFVLMLYFLVWRPQSKRVKQHRDLIGNLQKGDEVITTGGILGTITKIDESVIHLNIAENVEVTLQKAAISAAVPKGTISGRSLVKE